LKWGDRSKEIIRTGVGALSEEAKAHTRLPAGHPEGFIEALPTSIGILPSLYMPIVKE